MNNNESYSIDETGVFPMVNNLSKKISSRANNKNSPLIISTTPRNDINRMHDSFEQWLEKLKIDELKEKRNKNLDIISKDIPDRKKSKKKPSK